MVLHITIFRIPIKDYICERTIRELWYVFIYSFETVIKGYMNSIEIVAM